MFEYGDYYRRGPRLNKKRTPKRSTPEICIGISHLSFQQYQARAWVEMRFHAKVTSDRDRFYSQILPQIAHQGCIQKVRIFECCEFFCQHNASKPSVSGLAPFVSSKCASSATVLDFIDSIHRFYRFYRFYSRLLRIQYHLNHHPVRPMLGCA